MSVNTVIISVNVNGAYVEHGLKNSYLHLVSLLCFLFLFLSLFLFLFFIICLNCHIRILQWSLLN